MFVPLPRTRIADPLKTPVRLTISKPVKLDEAHVAHQHHAEAGLVGAIQHRMFARICGECDRPELAAATEAKPDLLVISPATNLNDVARLLRHIESVLDGAERAGECSQIGVVARRCDEIVARQTAIVQMLQSQTANRFSRRRGRLAFKQIEESRHRGTLRYRRQAPADLRPEPNIQGVQFNRRSKAFRWLQGEFTIENGITLRALSPCLRVMKTEPESWPRPIYGARQKHFSARRRTTPGRPDFSFAVAAHRLACLVKMVTRTFLTNAGLRNYLT